MYRIFNIALDSQIPVSESSSASGLISISPATGMGALMALVAQTFIIDVTDKGLMAKHFRHCRKSQIVRFNASNWVTRVARVGGLIS